MNYPVSRFQKFLYAILFVLIIPIGLWFWAKYTENLILFPAIESQNIGLTFMISGSSLILWGMHALWKYGEGLPMNISPPAYFVKKGPYRIVRDPIYWGFGIFMTGIFTLTGSASGLWLVTPVSILSMIALVWGYERIDLRHRFPNEKSKTLLDLPINNSELPLPVDRLLSLFKILALLILANYLVLNLEVNISPLRDFSMPTFENDNLFLLNLIFIVFVPFILKRNDFLREWALAGMISLFLSNFISLLLPSIGSQYLPKSDLGQESGWEIVVMSMTVPLFLIFISLKFIFKQSKKWFVLFVFITVPFGFIQLTNSRSIILSLALSIVIFLLATNYLPIWRYLKDNSEKIANSWHEWVFGKVRIINHGFYVGFGAFLGILLSGLLAGKVYAWAILVFAITVLVFSGLWAQIIEGSDKLKRPYGFYGGLIGTIFASLIVWMMGFNYWIIVGVVSIFMPWVQAIGRLRCLVNGCCHGRPVENPEIGIRYFHTRSRVSGISGLKGKLLYPTPLYSIIWLFFVGFVLLSLWYHSFSSGFIFGLYLILTGIGRFVEEAYRGEVQTPIINGLRLYQWTAILSVIVGIIVTIIPMEPVTITYTFGWEILVSALIGGLFTLFIMGVDFPCSNARFSRLV